MTPHTLEDPSLWRPDAEYRANWGLDLSGFDAAYAAGAYGQHIKVGVLDDGTWSGHDEFKTRNNVKGFGGPFGGTETPAISSAGQLLDHGLHVAGIIGANRDGKGMHGGAFLSTIYAGIGAGAGSKLTEQGAAQAVIDSGIDFLNNSWGNPFHRTIHYPSPTSDAGNVSEYSIPISVELDGSLRRLHHGPDIHTSDRVSKQLLRGNRVMLQRMLDIARSGTVNVFAAGNDAYKTALFRGISPAPLTVTLPNLLAAGPSWLENDVSTVGDTYRALSSRLRIADVLSQGVDRYRSLLTDVNALDAETRRDPRIVRLADHLQLLLGPVGDKDTGLDKLAELGRVAGWRTAEPGVLQPLKKLRADFLAIRSLTEADLEKYLANTQEQLDRLDPVDKLHPSVITFQTERATLAADRDLYKRGKFEPSILERTLLQSVRTQDDFRQVEKHWLTVANISNDERISLSSNICGPSKYYCLSAPGGSYSQVMGAASMSTPEVPAGIPLFDQHGNALQGTVPAFDYQIFSLGITTTAPAGSSNAEKQAAATSAYHMKGGTSMAAPHATAALAVIKSRFPYLENAQVRDTLLSTAKDLGAPGIDRVYGWGLIDLEKAMGGPAKFWQLKKDHDLTFAEQRAAEKYNPIVAKADYYERSAPLARFAATFRNQPLLSQHNLLAREINRLSQEINATNAEARSAQEASDMSEAIRLSALAQAKYNDVQKKIAEADRLADEIRKNDALANEAMGLARANELTRDQPNEPEDTLAAAFEYFDFRVDLPGERSATCDSQACVADYWSNDIDGPGGLTKLGEGALALTGDNTYEGGTRIDGGVLQFGMGGTTGSVTGNIVNNAVLAFHRSDEWAFRDVISGTGALETYGGTLRLLGSNTYSGDTQVNGGFLAVDGRVASRVNVNDGGRLGGYGRIGSLVVRNGGTLALGPSVGTLTVSDDARFEPGSLYDVKIAADRNSSDQLQVLGAVDLQGGTVSVRMEGEANPLDQVSAEALFSRKYDIITAQRGVTNRFDGVTPQYNYITAQLDYGDSNKVVLNFDLTQEAKSEEARQKQAELEARERELASLTAQPEEMTPVAALEPAADPLAPTGEIDPAISPVEPIVAVEPEPVPPVVALDPEVEPQQPIVDIEPITSPVEPVASAEPEVVPPVAALEPVADPLPSIEDIDPAVLPVDPIVAVEPEPVPPVVALDPGVEPQQPIVGTEPVTSPVEPVASVEPEPVLPVAVLDPETDPQPSTSDIEPTISPAEPIVATEPEVVAPVAVLDPVTDPLQPAAPDAAVAALEADVQRRKLELLDLRFRELDLLGATTPNQKQVGESLKSFGVMSDHPLVAGLLGSRAGVVPDFDSLSGDMHASLQGVLPGDSRFVSRIALDRLRMRFAEPLTAEYDLVDGPLLAGLGGGGGAFAFASTPKQSLAWIQAYGGWSHADSDGNAAGYHSNSGGLVMGVDGVAGNDWRLGLLASLGNTSLKTDTGRASIDNYRVGVYGGMQIQGVGVRLGANLAWHRIDTERRAHWFDLTEKNEASYGATSAEVYGEVGYRMATPVAVVEPFVSVSHVTLRTEGFEEDGAITGLAGSSATTHTGLATIGVHASRELAVSKATPLTVRGMLGRSKAFSDLSPQTSIGFVGGDTFEIQGLPMARERTTVELGLDAAFGRNTRLGVAYTRQFAEDITDSAIKADLQIRF